MKIRTFQTKRAGMVSERGEDRLRAVTVDLSAEIRRLDCVLKEKRNWALFTLWEKLPESHRRTGTLVVSCKESSSENECEWV